MGHRAQLHACRTAFLTRELSDPQLFSKVDNTYLLGPKSRAPIQTETRFNATEDEAAKFREQLAGMGWGAF